MTNSYRNKFLFEQVKDVNSREFVYKGKCTKFGTTVCEDLISYTLCKNSVLLCKMIKGCSSVILIAALICSTNAYDKSTNEKPVKSCNCIIPLNYEPVCGTNSKTYGNKEALNCENQCNYSNIKVAHQGRCDDVKPTERPCPCVVPLIYLPVCASDGKTYNNEYEVACKNKCRNANIEVLNYGKCAKPHPIVKPCDCPIPYTYIPVCGNNGKTYVNIQELNCEKTCSNINVREAHAGACKPKNPCDCIVPAIFAPVCGTDGKTYTSEYELRCANRCNGSRIGVVHTGGCTPKKPCDCSAITIYKPVCGTDGKTYGNSGVLGCANKCDNTYIGVAHEGECPRPSQSA